MRRIRTVWNAGYGVVSLTLQPSGLTQEESLTRQSLIVTALGKILLWGPGWGGGGGGVF